MDRPFDSTDEPDGSQLQCRVCSRAFKRSGHLRRHERTHLAARPFQCNQCSRTFTRRDALQRHANSHLGVPNLVQQGSRACTLCASAKTRCSGDVPCKRCSDRGFDCVYPGRDLYAPNQLSGNGPVSVATGSSGDSLLPSDSIDLQPLPHQSPDDLMPPAVPYPYQDWSDGFFHETNWLEGPIVPDMNLSPLPWIFGSFTQSVGPLDDTSPSGITNAGAGLDANHEHGAGEGASHMVADLSSPVRDHPSGEYYVDDEPARLPRVRRGIEPSKKGNQAQTAWTGTFSLHVQDPTVVPKAENKFEISEVNYQSINGLYHRLCRLEGPLGVTFTQHDLPPKPVFEAFAALFCDKFNHVLPFLHWTTIASESRSYILDLAIVAVGSQFAHDAYLSVAFHEFTRRCLIIVVSEEPVASVEKEFYLAAALLLNTVGSSYCGDERLRQQALQSRSQVSAHFERLKQQIESSSVDSVVDSLANKWQAWIRLESNIRLSFSMWLVDTMLAAHYEAPAIFGLESVSFVLPSGDEIWQCKDAESWNTLYRAQYRQSTLVEMLQKLYYNKSFPNTQTEFVRILAIHGLFHRLWEVGRYYSSTLSHWEPSSTTLAAASNLPKTAPWLPAVPTFRTWQNASCDALDVLHWQANSTIGQMRGLEHPTVLHLHFARVVLLCPCSDILALARHLAATSSVAASRNEINRATNTVRRWAVQHQYKARLAAIHAGVTFWHIRRHGIDAFYESASLGLAALVLWAFSLFAESQLYKSRAQSVSQGAEEPATSSTAGEAAGARIAPNGKGPESPESGEIILLDRPTDDELVQQFIRDGANMRPHMTDVGEVFGLQAPRQILSRGIVLLQDQGCWGSASEWTRLLQALRASRRLESRSH